VSRIFNWSALCHQRSVIRSNEALCNVPPAPPCRPRPNEPLWSLWHNHHAYEAQLRYHGEYGVEAQILRDGEVLAGYRFQTRALAVQWAEQERESGETKSTRGGTNGSSVL
jgi:hypothetical protein